MSEVKQPKSVKNIYTALLEAQRAMGPVLKNATNPAFRSRYADLSAVIETITEPLHNAGILFTQPLVMIDGEQYIQTVLTHAETGTKTDSFYKVVSKDPNDPQKVGGAITYGRRYSLLSILGLAPEDDDGNEASKPSQGASSPSKPQPQPQADTTPEDTPDGECSHCGKHVAGKSVYWSNKKHGRTLCWNCQKLAESGDLLDPKSNIPQGDIDAELDSLFKAVS